MRIGLDHFARRDDELAKAERHGSLRRNFQGYSAHRAASVLGFGASSISALPRGYAQNAARIPEWRRLIDAGRLATARGLAIGPEDALRGAIIERLMCEMQVDVAAICSVHAWSLSRLAPEFCRLREMEADGLVKLRRARIEVTDRGRPFARAIAAIFDARREPARSGRHVPSV